VPGIQEWLVIAVIALIVLGPDRLPGVARQAGQLLARLRAESQRSMSELQRIAEVRELQDELRGLTSDLRTARDDAWRGLDGATDRRRRGDGRAVTTPFDPEAT
jgi:sec-independent protein translocase protein TatB